MTGDAPCSCKVGKTASKYGMEELPARLEGLWIGETDERHSLRELADHFNQCVLERAMEDEGVDVVYGETENVYRALTTESGVGLRTQVRGQLERHGLDTEAVESDFVTHQTVYRHLKNCREAEYETDEGGRVERDRQRLEALQNRVATVTETTLSRLRDAEEIALEEFDVYADVNVLCESCGEVHTPADLLEDGGCDCQR